MVENKWIAVGLIVAAGAAYYLGINQTLGVACRNPAVFTPTATVPCVSTTDFLKNYYINRSYL